MLFFQPFFFPLVFPLYVTIVLVLAEFMFQIHVAFLLLAYCALFSFVSFLIFFFFYCAVGGRLSLYNFSRLSLIIPLSSMPSKSLNYTTPPSVTDFTSYVPNQCIMSFPGCCNYLLSYINTRSPSLNIFFLMCLSCQALSLSFFTC
jgi:hypothetical protein